MRTRHYFDYNASAPISTQAYKILVDSLHIYANPSSTHREGLAAKNLIETARVSIAKNLALNAHNIIFTSGATEAASTLLTPNYVIGKKTCYMSHLYVGSTEHQCILSGGQFSTSNISKIPVLNNGLIDIIALDQQLQNHQYNLGLPLVAIQGANSETGVIQDIEKLAALVHTHKAILITDIVQLLGKVPIDINKMGSDFYIISSHKLGGPKNIGAIIAQSEIIAPTPLIKGKQEKGRRGGTQSPALCASFAAALNEKMSNISSDFEIRDYLEAQLSKMVPDIIIYGKTTKRLPNTSFFRIPHIEAQTLQIALDLEGYAVSAGSACSSGSIAGSHVLEAIGEGAGVNAIRVSLGPNHTREDIDVFINKLSIILERG